MNESGSGIEENIVLPVGAELLDIILLMILSVPFYLYNSVRTILSIPFYPYHLVRYHFDLEPLKLLRVTQLVNRVRQQHNRCNYLQ